MWKTLAIVAAVVVLLGGFFYFAVKQGWVGGGSGGSSSAPPTPAIATGGGYHHDGATGGAIEPPPGPVDKAWTWAKAKVGAAKQAASGAVAAAGAAASGAPLSSGAGGALRYVFVVLLFLVMWIALKTKIFKWDDIVVWVVSIGGLVLNMIAGAATSSGGVIGWIVAKISWFVQFGMPTSSLWWVAELAIWLGWFFWGGKPTSPLRTMWWGLPFHLLFAAVAAIMVLAS